MKIGYISDIHLDFYAAANEGKIKRFANSLVPEGTQEDYYDVLIVAGDIGHYNADNIILLKELKKYAKNIMCTTGNHDYYLVNRNQRKYFRTSDDKVKNFEDACRVNDIELMNPGILTLYIEGKQVNILGFNGWYDGSYLKKDKFIVDRFWNTGMNDSRLIHPTGVKFDDRHYKDMAAVNKLLDQCSSIDIVFSHVSPSTNPEHIQEKYRNDDYTDFFCFDGSKILERINPKVWFYGHTHGGLDYSIGDTKFLCNTLGYPHEQESTRKIKEFTFKV